MNRKSEKVELRLSTTASTLRRLPACAALASLAVSSARSSRVVSVYWDTPELDLRAARISLRTHRIDDRAWVQTLTTEGRAPASPDEYEARLPGQRADLRLARQAGWRGHAELDDREDRLRPVIVSRIVRATRAVEFADGTTVDLCIDRGDLRVGDLPRARERVVEIKLELTDGSACRLYELAYRLVRELPSARILFASEPDRGYALSAGTPGEPRRALDIIIPRRSTPRVVAVSAAAESLVHIQSNVQHARLGLDPEGVHQMRVGVRRLRAADAISRIFSEGVKEEIKWLWRLLGATRDWNVFETETWPVAKHRTAIDARAAADFESTISMLREASHEKLRRALNSQRFQLLMLALGWSITAHRESMMGASSHRSAKRWARRLLARRAARMRDDGDAIDRLTDEQRHRLRIDAKKLRYPAEFLAGLYPSRASRRYLRRLAAVQAALGGLNDLAVSGKLFRSVVAALPAPRRALAAQMSMAYAAAQLLELKQQLQAAWRSFAKAEPFWE